MASFSVATYSSSERLRSSSGSEVSSLWGSPACEVSAIGGSSGTSASGASSAQLVRVMGRKK